MAKKPNGLLDLLGFRLAEPTQPMAPAILPEEKTNDSSAFDAGARSQFKALGSSGTDLYSGYFKEEYLQELRGRKGAKLFDEIRRSEAQVSMLLNAIMNPIKAGVWEFEAADPNEVPNAEMHKEIIEFMAKDLS